MVTAKEYASEVTKYANEIGQLDWCAPQDWMCEPSALKASGLTVPIHQKLTLENFLELRQRLGLLVVPVLQGWHLDDYTRHADAYMAAGVDLTKEQTIGLGSVCRRNAENEIGAIIGKLHPLRLHGFGIKGTAFIKYNDRLTSADSMAWSFAARYKPPLQGCNHRACNHCPKWALTWRRSLLNATHQPKLF